MCSGHLLFVLCPESLRPFTSFLCLSHPPTSVWFASVTNICEFLQRTSLRILPQFRCAHKEQEVPWSLHQPGASHSPWLAGVRILKLSPFCLRWDNSEREFTPWELPWGLGWDCTLLEVKLLLGFLSFPALLGLSLTSFSWEHLLHESLLLATSS